MRIRSLFAAGLLLPAIVCESGTPVANAARTARFDFMNGPSDLPNVFRGDSILLFVWPDYSTNLVIAVNAPAGGVASLRRCGGPLRPDPQPVQTVGEMDLCQASPIAQGTGILTSTDNDRLVTGNGANAFSFRAQGIVDLVAGGSARVIAESERLIRPDGTRETLVNNVTLLP